MRRTTLILLAFVTLGILSCTGSIPRPTAQHHSWIQKRLGMDKDLERGYTLYVANCSGCHSLHSPSAYSDSAWAVVFPEMRQKSNLNDAEADLVLAYITSASALAKAH